MCPAPQQKKHPPDFLRASCSWAVRVVQQITSISMGIMPEEREVIGVGGGLLDEKHAWYLIVSIILAILQALAKVLGCWIVTRSWISLFNPRRNWSSLSTSDIVGMLMTVN